MKFRIVPRLLVIQERRRSIIVGTALGVLIGLITAILVIAITGLKSPVTVLPDFSTIGDIRAKKRAFIDFLLPIIERENLKILNDRIRVKEIAVQVSDGKPISKGTIKWVKRLAEKYGIPVPEEFSSELFTRLLTRVDIIPPSLTLAQAANESGWGGSRFAVAGNNLFGFWCHTPGCGIIPNSRVEGATHEVKLYNDVSACVEDYLRNLNKNRAYRELRSIRVLERKNDRILSGYLLASGLLRYSSRGQAYVREIQSLIRANGLAEYDI